LSSVEVEISIDMYCWQAAKNHKPRSLNYCFFANQRLSFFAMLFLPFKGFALTGNWKTAKCDCLWNSAHCHVRMLAKQG